MHYFQVCLAGCFWKRLAPESVDCIKIVLTPAWVGIIQSVEGPNEQKGRGSMNLLSELGPPSSPALGHQCSWPLDSGGT